MLDPHIIGERVNLITMDLSYLAVADAIGQIDRQLLAPAAQLIALIKPTFELHAAALADRPGQVTAAVDAAERALRHHGWRGPGTAAIAHPRSKGAAGMLMHAAYRLVAIDTVRYSTRRRLVDPVMSAGEPDRPDTYLTRWFQLALRQTDAAGYP